MLINFVSVIDVMVLVERIKGKKDKKKHEHLSVFDHLTVIQNT